MASEFPGQIDTFTTKTEADTVEASHVNDLQDAIVATQTELTSGNLTNYFLSFYVGSVSGSVDVCGGANEVGLLLGRPFRLVGAYACGQAPCSGLLTLNIYKNADIIDSTCTLATTADVWVSNNVDIAEVYETTDKLAFTLTENTSADFTSTTFSVELRNIGE